MSTNHNENQAFRNPATAGSSLETVIADLSPSQLLSNIHFRTSQAAHLQQCNRNLELIKENKDLTAQLTQMRKNPLAQTGMIADAVSSVGSAPFTRIQLKSQPSRYAGVNLYWTEKEGRKSRTGENTSHAKALIPDSIRFEDGRVITKPEYNNLRASARRELEAAADGRSWGQLDRFVKQRLLGTLELQFPILQLCASNYKAKRVYEEILAGRNRTSRSKRKAEVEVEAEVEVRAEAEVETAGSNAGLGKGGDDRALGSDDVRGRLTNSQEKRRRVGAASSNGEGEGQSGVLIPTVHCLE